MTSAESVFQITVQPSGRAFSANAGEAILAAAIRQVFLQVEEGNAGAQALYRRLGFRYSHRYHYRVAPESGR